MSLLRADRVANRFNNTGPVIVGPSTVHGDFTITGDLIVAGIAVTNSVQIGAALTVRDFTVQQQSTLNNLTVTGVTTVGLVTGSSATYFGDGSGLSGIVTTAGGTRGIQVLPNTGPGAGVGSITIRAVDVPESGFANVAAGATNLTGGDSGRIPYQINPGETGYSATGNTGEILLSGGTGSPTWSSLAAINVAYADSAGIATDLYGGSGGRLVYQSGIDQTAFVPTGLTGRILMAKGSGTPEWLDARVGLSVSFAKFAGVSTNVTGGIASVTHLSVGENGSGIATFFGPLQAVDINVSGLTTTSNLEVTGIATINQLEVGPRGNTLVGITSILDEDDMVSDRADALVTQQSIKKYVDDLVTAQDLDYAGDNGSGSIDLDSQVFNIIGGANQVYTNVSGQTITVGFTTNVTIANDLTVTSNASLGSLNVSGISTLETLGVNGVLTTPFANVTGVATITRLNSTQNEFTDINLTGVATARTLDVTGVTSTANLRVTGISTLNRFEVTGIATFKNDIYLTSGNTFYNANLSNPNLVGVTTAQRFEFDVIDGPYANITGIATIANIQSTTVNVSGVSTFSDNVGIASLNVSGITTLSHLGVTGVTTTENLQVAGITTINDLIASGIATFTGSLDVSGSIGINSAVLTGVTTISELDVTGDASITGNAGIGSLNVTGISTFSDITVTGNAGIGSLNVTGISTLETLGVTGTASAGFLEVTGVSTFSNDVQISQDLSVTGNAGIGSLNVSGISTFSNITVTGNAGIGSLNVTGVSTLGVTTATSLSLNEVIVSGLTTTVTLNVGDTTSGIGATIQNYGGAVFAGIITAAGIDVSGGEGGSATFSDITVSGNAGIGSLNVTGISTFNDDVQLSKDLNVTGNADIGSLNVTGISTFNDDVQLSKDLNVTGNADIGSLNITGITTLGGFTTITDSLYVSGIASVGTMITMYGNTGVVSATSFYGDGSNLTGVVGLVSVTNIVFVTPDGNDNNDGYLVSTAKRTVGAALTIAKSSTVVKISAGNYPENNPIILPEQVTLLGDSLREVSIVPQNPSEDLIYVANGSYVENMSFTGSLNEGKAIIAFNPNKPSYVTQGPYIRNCTNFISNSIGMKIDGAHVIGDTRAMNVDSYTQINQGGIGVSISNEGYAQLVSIFTIYNDQSIVCSSGGQCDLTNSNSSFGRLGLVADGIGPTNFTGIISEFQSAGSNTFPISLSVDAHNISNAVYDNTTGLTTFTTATNHGFNIGMPVTMRDLKFSCDSQDVVREVSVSQQTPFDVSAANYNQSTGKLTVTTSGNHNFNKRSVVELNQLVFQCDSGGGVSTAFFPPLSFGEGNGAVINKFVVDEISSTNQFIVDVGVSTIAHTYVEGGTSTLRPSQFGITTALYTASTGIMTVTTSSDHNFKFKTAVNLDSLVFECNSGEGISTALFPPAAGDGNGATTSRFSVQEIPNDRVFVVNVGVSTIAHGYISGGTATNTPYYGITTATYNNTTGVLTFTTDIDHNISVGISVTMTNLVFECNSGEGISTALFPPAAGDGNGAVNHVFDVISVNGNDVTVNVGPSTIAHGYIDNGLVSISTIASFPNGSFGDIFTVNNTPSANEFTAYVGVSTYPSLYHSGGQVETYVTRPYDGQVVYFDDVYNIIKGVTITNGGSGYTEAPLLTFSNPSESWGIKATGTAILTNGKVTGVQMISNGRGYTGTPTVTIAGAATGTPDILPTYYVVSSSTPISQGISTVTFTDNVPYAVGVGTTVPFFKQSRVLASSQAFEYIGSGNTALTALPQRGGVAIPENEIVNKNGGLVIFTSTDQAGNFKIGEGVIINQLEGSITGDAYNRSLFANITPYILALGGD